MIRLLVDEILIEKNMSQKDLCRLSGLNPSTISEICRGIRGAINTKHLEAIMNALEIEDFNQIMSKDVV